MKNAITLFLFLIFFLSIKAQPDKRGTIVIKKSTCLDLELYFFGLYSDTLTISEVNKANGFIINVRDCMENHQMEIQSYDLSINQSASIHYTKPCDVSYTLKKISNETTIAISNCFVKFTTPKESDKMITIATKTFYIIANK